MPKFTQEQLKELEQKARGILRTKNPVVSKFIGIEKGEAVFGFRLDVPPRCKVGLPMFIRVTPNGSCTEVEERNEIFRYMAEWH